VRCVAVPEWCRLCIAFLCWQDFNGDVVEPRDRPLTISDAPFNHTTVWWFANSSFDARALDGLVYLQRHAWHWLVSTSHPGLTSLHFP